MKKLNKTTYIRNNGGSFTMTPNHLLDDKRISPEAQIIMIHIIRNNDNWIINKDEILKRVRLTECRFKKAWKELKKYGYIEPIRRQGYWLWIINEKPALTMVTDNHCEDNEAGNDILSTDAGTTCKEHLLYNTNRNNNKPRLLKTKVLKGRSQTGDNSSDKRMNSVTSNEVPSGSLRFDSLLNEVLEDDTLDLDLGLDIDFTSINRNKLYDLYI